jgi:TolB-like protein
VARLNPITLFQELRRRRVFRLALIYGVGAWGVIAACDVLFPQLSRWVADPDRAMRAVIIAAIALSPVALVFGWLYDVTAEGLQRTADFSETAHDPDTSLHPVDRGIIGTLCVLVAAVLVLTSVHIVRMAPPESGGAPTAPANSIAVLPFEICEGPGVDPLLAAGVAHEVLNHLAEIPNLKVTARSLLVVARASAFAFAETDMEPQRIAATLRVHYLLTGTVCRDGDALVVTGELVDESGYLVWSHRYTEQLDASGQVTRSAAALLAEGVAARMGAVMPVPQGEPVDRVAYEHLLVGRERHAMGDHDGARAAFEAALERKPDYAEAIFELALLEYPSLWETVDQKAQYEKTILLAERALAMARRDLERNPDSAHSHYVVGNILRSLMRLERHLSLHKSASDYTDGRREKLAEAERHLRRAVELNPSNGEAWADLFLAMEEAGRDGPSLLKVLEQGIERDPFNGLITGQLAIQWARRGRYEEALALLERLKRLPDVHHHAWLQGFRVNEMRYRYDELNRLVIEMLQHESYRERVRRRGRTTGFALGIVQYLPWCGTKLEEEQKAIRSRLGRFAGEPWFRDSGPAEDERLSRDYEQASRMTDKEVLDLGISRSGELVEALRHHGDYDRAIRIQEAIAKEQLFGSIRTWAPNLKVRLAIMYLEAGRDADAAVVLEELAQLLEPMVGEGIRNGITLHQLAQTQALQGRVDAAISTLELSEASGNGTVFKCNRPEDYSAVLDPFAALRSDPRFQKLHDRCIADWERQCEVIRARLAEHDLDVLLEPLVALAEKESTGER